jgi:N-acetylglucosaminyldiphosphoundecaprenol N-acetyl-beta-D-mannosaminyltransferase
MAELGVPVSIGIGACFDFLSGRIPRAPKLVQDLGCEWIFRLWQEPGRLRQRYLRDDLPFMLRMLAGIATSRFRPRQRAVLEAFSINGDA